MSDLNKAIALRMDRNRPSFENELIKILSEILSRKGYSYAIDIACGTGHSTKITSYFSTNVVGIDADHYSVEICKDKGFKAEKCVYQNYSEDIKYDLIMCGNAFQWFDKNEAVNKFLRLSAPGAQWVIYNFFLTGCVEVKEFKNWFEKIFRKNYVSPFRGRKSTVLIETDFYSYVGIRKLSNHSFSVPVKMSKHELVSFLMTYSNIVKRQFYGESYRDLFNEIINELNFLNDIITLVFEFKLIIVTVSD